MYYIKRSKTPLGEIKTKDGLIILKLFQTCEHLVLNLKYNAVLHSINLSISTIFRQAMLV